MPVPNDREVRVCALPEMRVAERADGQADLPTLTGYAALFNVLSEPIWDFRERIQPGAFRDSLKSGDDVRALVEHKGGLSSLGRTSSGTLSLAEDDKGLRVEIQPPDTQAGRDTVELVRRGDLTQMSFAFRTIDDEWHTEDDETVRVLQNVELFDVSVVSFPAYPDTSVAVRAAKEYTAALNDVDRRELLKRRLDLRRRNY